MGVYPQGSEIIPNPYNRIPGFSLGHVHFFPGFPAMAWPMMEWTLDTYYSFWFDQRAWAENAVVVKSASEAMLTPMMEALEARYAGIKVFSLPPCMHGTADLRREPPFYKKGHGRSKNFYGCGKYNQCCIHFYLHFHWYLLK